MLPRNRRVLLVDDDADTREMYSWSLEARGFDVLTVDHAVSALAEAGTEPPDVIVTDLTLPGFDGLALIEKLKASPFTAAVPVILLSGRTLDSGDLTGVLQSCARVLLKPMLPDTLADVIASVLDEAAERIPPRGRPYGPDAAA